MAILAKVAFGQAFSDKGVTGAARLAKINDLDDLLKALRRSVVNSAAALVAADGLTFTDPDADEYEGNGTPAYTGLGINVDVQTAGEALWDELDTLT